MENAPHPSMRFMRVTYYFLLITLLLSGCMVGPRYHKHQVCMPAQFEEAKGEVVQDEDLCEWWTQFDDPVLDELIAEAVTANYDYLIALERINQARSQYRVETSYLWPEIDLNASATRSRISQNLFKGPGGNSFLPTFLNIFQVGFDAIWELDVWGKFRHGRNAALYTYEALSDDAQSVMISLISEVAVNYVAIRTLQDRIDLTQRKIAADERELDIVIDLHGIGLNNESKILTMISDIETDRATLPVLESSLKQTIYAVAYLLGRPPECFACRFDEFYPIPSGKNRVPVGLPCELLRRRPDVRSAERQLAAATEEIGTAVADLFPHIALTGISLGAGNKIGSSYGYDSNRIDNLITAPSRMFSFGVGMNWDLIDFGRVRANIDVKNSLQRQALLNYEKTIIASLQDVESALVAYYEEEKRRESLLIKVNADSRNLEIVENLFKIGLATEMQVLEAEKRMLDSENLFVESEQALVSDLIAIYKALGGSWYCSDCFGS